MNTHLETLFPTLTLIWRNSCGLTILEMGLHIKWWGPHDLSNKSERWKKIVSDCFWHYLYK